MILIFFFSQGSSVLRPFVCLGGLLASSLASSSAPFDFNISSWMRSRLTGVSVG